MDVFTKMIVEDQLEGKGFDSEAKEIAGKNYQKNYEEQTELLYNKYAGKGNDVNKASGNKNKTVVEMLADYNQATGENYVMGQNAVRGSDTNRSFAFTDAEGKEKVVSAKFVAETIAASKALEMMTGDAEKASEELGKL
jgi:hypothetical protein